MQLKDGHLMEVSGGFTLRPAFPLVVSRVGPRGCKYKIFVPTGNRTPVVLPVTLQKLKLSTARGAEAVSVRWNVTWSLKRSLWKYPRHFVNVCCLYVEQLFDSPGRCSDPLWGPPTGGKAAERSWPHTSIWCVEIYLHFPNTRPWQSFNA
jgi:hypothetical protein